MKKLALLGLLALLTLAGCSKRRTAEVPPDARPGGARATRVSLPVITVEEALPLFPRLDGVAVLKGPEKAKTGERVEAAYCFDSGEVPARAEEVKAALVAATWTDVQVRPRPSAPNDLVSLAARGPSFTLRGSVQRTKVAACSSDEGKVYVTIFIQKPHPAGERGDGIRAPKRPFGPGGPAALRPQVRPNLPVMPIPPPATDPQ